LTRLIETKRKSGVMLSVLGFGQGNYKDATMEKLADQGDGNYAYVDSLHEARKVFVEEISGTLLTIAKDVKTQVEFNPAKVSAYRLVGYENRLLAAEDFRDDAKDAGEIGAGHTVTALYEIVPAGAKVALAAVDPLKYHQPTHSSDSAQSDELCTVKLRYKLPGSDTSQPQELVVSDRGTTFAQASPDLQFAASVAGFGMLLRNSEHKGDMTFDSVLEIAQQNRGADKGGYRAEFIELVKQARQLKPR
ncbi:MAG: YfbK domain-containing protein, partial [Pirellulales bacterium]